MKKFLLVILSAALIITTVPSNCFAYTSPDRLHEYNKSSSSNEKNLYFMGRETPCSITINNTANAKSEADAKATADSKKSSTVSKIAKLLLAVVGIGVIVKFVGNTEKKYNELVEYVVANKNKLQEKINKSLNDYILANNSSNTLDDSTLNTEKSISDTGTVGKFLYTVVRRKLPKLLNIFNFFNKSVDYQKYNSKFTMPVASSSLGI